MRWPWQSDASKDGTAASPAVTSSSSSKAPANSSSSSSTFTSWTDSLNKTDWEHYKDPHAWVPPALAVAAALGFSAFYRSYLRRIPSTDHIQPRFFRRRSLFGRVTSVGDGDNFHLYHTPGGRIAGWGWLRKVPAYRKELKGNTIPIRIAGVDAPEGAHFGRPAQPYSAEALDFLTHYIRGRNVRAYLFRRDQYDRVVARVMVRRFLFFRRDVGIEMLKRGLATCYEAKTGVEFGGREAQYRVAEARAKARKRGLWSNGSNKGDLETPREYKTRMAVEEAEKAVASTPTTTTTTTTPKAATTSSTPAASKTPAATSKASTSTSTSAAHTTSSTASTAKPATPATSATTVPSSTFSSTLKTGSSKASPASSTATAVKSSTSSTTPTSTGSKPAVKSFIPGLN